MNFSTNVKFIGQGAVIGYVLGNIPGALCGGYVGMMSMRYVRWMTHFYADDPAVETDKTAWVVAILAINSLYIAMVSMNQFGWYARDCGNPNLAGNIVCNGLNNQFYGWSGLFGVVQSVMLLTPLAIYGVIRAIDAGIACKNEVRPIIVHPNPRPLIAEPDPEMLIRNGTLATTIGTLGFAVLTVAAPASLPLFVTFAWINGSIGLAGGYLIFEGLRQR